MKAVFDCCDRGGHSMVEVAFKGLCNRQQGGEGKEKRMKATIYIKVEYVGGKQAEDNTMRGRGR
jgi:hypothetical protein